MTIKIDEQLKRFQQIREDDIPKFNQLMRSKSVDAIILEEKEEMEN